MTAWRDQAACIGLSELFSRTFLPKRRRGEAITVQERAALAVCATCPVRQDCLDEELQTIREGAQSLGVFGGTTARQRIQMLKAGGWVYKRESRRAVVFGDGPCDLNSTTKR